MKPTCMLFLAAALAVAAADAEFTVRIKDVTRPAGVEDYTLVGYGLVTGLAGSGDSDLVLTQRTIANALHNFNIQIDEQDLAAQNCAVVMVTGTIRKAAHKGDHITVTVSSLGDAESLTGGELLLTPLLGLDGEPCAVAQGAVATGGFSFGNAGEAGGSTITKGHPTTGTLTNGAKLLKDMGTGIPDQELLVLCLNKPDMTMAVNCAAAINEKFFGSATAADAKTVRVRIPAEYRETATVAKFISVVEQLRFVPDQAARVVFNERTGTIVIGSDVRVSPVAITHGNIAISIKKIDAISQPPPFSRGDTERLADTTTVVREELARTTPVPAITTTGELVNVLNNLGVTPRDIMQIFQVLRASGALHAELEAL